MLQRSKKDCESRAANKYGHCTGGINLKTKNKNIHIALKMLI